MSGGAPLTQNICCSFSSANELFEELTSTYPISINVGEMNKTSLIRQRGQSTFFLLFLVSLNSNLSGNNLEH